MRCVASDCAPVQRKQVVLPAGRVPLRLFLSAIATPSIATWAQTYAIVCTSRRNTHSVPATDNRQPQQPTGPGRHVLVRGTSASLDHAPRGRSLGDADHRDVWREVCRQARAAIYYCRAAEHSIHRDAWNGDTNAQRWDVPRAISSANGASEIAASSWPSAARHKPMVMACQRSCVANDPAVTVAVFELDKRQRECLPHDGTEGRASRAKAGRETGTRFIRI